jgi:tetratricopeptide (TPR) repeat protein
MKNGLGLLAVSFLVVALPCFAQKTVSNPNSAPPTLSLSLIPGANFPIGESSAVLNVGWNSGLFAEFTTPRIPILSLAAGFDYAGNNPNMRTGASLLSDQNIQRMAFMAGLGASYQLAPWFALTSDVLAGYCFGRGNTGQGNSITGGSGTFSIGAGCRFDLGRYFGLRLRAAYRNDLGLQQGIEARAGVVGHIPFGAKGAQAPSKGAAPTEPVPDAQGPKPELLKSEPEKSQGEWLEVSGIVLASIFPIFYGYYDDHPVGSALLKNARGSAMKDVRASLLMDKFMDSPKEIKGPSELKPGEEQKIDLYALFNDKVMEITESMKVAVEITFSYELEGQRYQQKKTETMRIYDRNATVWDDNRKVCAFMTTKDPAVLAFAKNVNAIAKSRGFSTVNPNLLSAIALHEALTLFGLAYVADPTTPYAELSRQKESVDFLQFPRQTLEYKAGDCDDLTILYCSLLEAVGIETAFITVPGHIFMAFSLDRAPAEARKAFQRADELLLRQDSSWVPIEVTERSGGFLQAWQTGAKEWRENLARQQAEFYPVHEGWAVFQPVGLPGSGKSVELPASDRIAAAYQKELEKFVDREIYESVAKIQADMKKQGEAPRLVNQLGVLYARYGLYDRAERELQKAVAKEEYVPALLNLGSIAFARKDMDRALVFYERASKKDANNTKVLLGLARANHALENYGMVTRSYAKLKAADPDLARQFAYLDLRGEEAARAAAIGDVSGVVIWVEE